MSVTEPRPDITEKVRDIIAQQLGVGREEVTLKANFANDLGADSLDTVELVLAIESEFDIQIPDNDSEEIANLGQAIVYIEKAVSK